MLSFHSHKTIVFDDKDPPWINSKFKYLINQKKKEYAVYKHYLKNNKSGQSFELFQLFRDELSSLFTNLKDKYH